MTKPNKALTFKSSPLHSRVYNKMIKMHKTLRPWLHKVLMDFKEVNRTQQIPKAFKVLQLIKDLRLEKGQRSKVDP